MDNIVDYLIAGFFIISFLASIFKKKKVKETSGKNVKPISVSGQQRVPERKAKAKSPFDDFFKAINVELANAKKEVSHSEVDEYYEEAMQNSDSAELPDQESSKLTYQESSKLAYQEASKLTKSSLQISEVESAEKESAISIKSYSDSVQYTKGQHESSKAKDIKNKLLKTDSIKEFIIVNEILGKPKALQR
jgi:hypothetical protein